MAGKHLQDATDKIKALLGDYDAIHVHRGDKLKTKMDRLGLNRAYILLLKGIFVQNALCAQMQRGFHQEELFSLLQMRGNQVSFHLLNRNDNYQWLNKKKKREMSSLIHILIRT